MSPKKIEFNNGETVVYPKHGVGEIIKIESMEIASIKTMFYVVKMEQSKLTIRVPRNIKLLCRIDTIKELDYYKQGGILQYVLNSIIKKAS